MSIRGEQLKNFRGCIDKEKTAVADHWSDLVLRKFDSWVWEYSSGLPATGM